MLAPRWAKCIMLGLDINFPRRTFRVRDLTTGQVARQIIVWRPNADAGEAVSGNTATKGGWRGARHGHCLPRPKKASHYTSSLRSLEIVSEEPEYEQHEPGGAGGPKGAFALERVEHETGGGGGWGRRGQLRMSLNRKKRLCQSRKRMSREKTRPTTRVSRTRSRWSKRRPSGGTGRRTKTVRPVYRCPSTHHANPHEKWTRRCLAPRSDARGGRQPFATRADHAPRSTGVPEMVKLAARAENGNGRAARARDMKGSSLSQREDGARHQNHLQTKNRKGRTNKKVQVQIRGSGIPTYTGHSLR